MAATTTINCSASSIVSGGGGGGGGVVVDVPPGSGSSPFLSYPCPRSPPKYPDMTGKHRELVKVQKLEREIGFLEEELKSVENLQPASRSCKEVDSYVGANPDPLIPVYEIGRLVDHADSGGGSGTFSTSQFKAIISRFYTFCFSLKANVGSLSGLYVLCAYLLQSTLFHQLSLIKLGITLPLVIKGGG
ncbi:hypothetical protein MKW94_026863 [Papaver nudicaule]|uniref:G protein gamma domain-containing protein n=1 Tax=Papaver nudicaule TaxID=74823 RepID=A0AA41VPU4_PAPNU|nr:hypothetical protein [Papaver nudicaule]